MSPMMINTSNRLGENAAAKSGRQFRMIAIRLREWSEWGRHVIRGVQRFAHDRPNWRLYVEAGPTEESRIFRKRLAVDGILTGISTDIKVWRRKLQNAGTKLVGFSAATPRTLTDIPRVRVDEAKVAQAIGRHFLAGGFRHFAYWGTLDPAIEDARLNGFLAFAQAQECPCHLFRPTNQNSSSQARIMMRWVAKLPKPVGIAAWNMDVARRLVEACERSNLSVPEQVAVVAWDDDPMLAETLEPTISAIVLPAERLGFEAANLLNRLMTSAATPKLPVVIEPSGILRVRQSSDVATLKNRDVHLAVQYIHEHAHNGLKVTQIADALRVSRRKLEYDFPRVVGHTVHDVIVGVELERAKQLLLETDWGVERIAQQAGMGTKQTFRRLMLRYEKMTPSEFRSRFSGA